MEATVARGTSHEMRALVNGRSGSRNQIPAANHGLAHGLPSNPDATVLRSIGRNG